MIVLHPFASLPSCTTITCSKPFSHDNHFVPSSIVLRLVKKNARTKTFLCSASSLRDDLNGQDFSIDIINKDQELVDDEDGGVLAGGMSTRREAKDIDEEVQEYEDNDGGYSSRGPYTGRPEKDYDRDPEFGNILGGFLEDPQASQSKLEERLRKKRNKILHTKTGSGKPMTVSFNKVGMHMIQKLNIFLFFFNQKITFVCLTPNACISRFDFSNSYIWFEFYNILLAKDVSLICDTIRAWHIIGRLGGCNSMNMQLSQSPMEAKPSYDYIQGANVEPSTFYNIGDLEVQENLARIWVDIGTVEPLLLDVLINALTQISSDFVGIKQVMFGGAEFENWKEDLKSEDSGYGVHKI
ncbi:uncharacterized protein LOC109803970 isoform X1 [Cajanus cajan]|uniref:uncharacterized protein LOC109803970 isoform X1 n=1 Tax=Cajanus cajan TaxID=3821 RepID=UPI0010FB9205|nr:uncharacterized protein LOC109803970 isoform X1 [Cajanus cajan]XP_029128353.1 uncharacterized protein LOC109803970 isoform X1 [Cajanus cajan]XP_029128354.1 uncharacterized protein LOC109803970 isoform X1 [Cajanus cajan]